MGEFHMIVDRLDNWKIYFRNHVWETIFVQLRALNENTPAMEKKISDDIILKVFSYETIGPADPEAELESHKKYIDIHITITKSEMIEWYPTAILKIIKPYDVAEDAVYYERPQTQPQPAYASLKMYPGMFAMFWPNDAHMSKLQGAGKSELVKKAVMKVSIDLAR
jgi:YhcH/YjgK/YiaL family protein